jgi:hypothetical protein
MLKHKSLTFSKITTFINFYLYIYMVYGGVYEYVVYAVLSWNLGLSSC